MVKKSALHKRFFYIQCGDWDAITVAPTPREACSMVIDQAMEKFRENMQMTDVILAMDCQNSMNTNENEIAAFPVAQLLKELS